MASVDDAEALADDARTMAVCSGLPFTFRTDGATVLPISTDDIIGDADALMAANLKPWTDGHASTVTLPVLVVVLGMLAMLPSFIRGVAYIVTDIIRILSTLIG
jgi:hypothetical protein